MGLQGIRVCLRGGGGEKPMGDAFFKLLGIEAGFGFGLSPSRSAWQWAIAELFVVQMDDVKNEFEPTEVFANRIREGFERASLLLQKCSLDGLRQWRASDKMAGIFIGGWLAIEQFDLDIPAAFLSECARLELALSICTND